MQVRLLREGGEELRWMPNEGPHFSHTASGGVTWRAAGIVPNSSRPPTGCRRLRLEVRGELDTDGLAQMSVTLTVAGGRAGGGGGGGTGGGLARACALSDVQVTLPLVESATRLINGFGKKGGPRPADLRYRWDGGVTHGQRGLNCRVWLGGADAGLQLNLQGLEQSRVAASSHCGNDDSGNLQCNDMSDAQYNVALGSAVWYNKNAGGATIRVQPAPRAAAARRRLVGRAESRGRGGGGGGGGREAAADVALLTVFTGPLTLQHGAEPLSLPFRLLLTPVRGAGQPRLADFATRYFHMQRFTPVDTAVAAAPDARIVLHQGNQLNPYINYPFLTVAPLRKYVAEAHAKGAKVKLYYTVRELSTSAPEIWALRSLGGEVVVPSRSGGGHAWLQEHWAGVNYSASWHERLADGEVDTSVHTPAFTTRWDNYWIEGILWLVRNLDIDGTHCDGLTMTSTLTLTPSPTLSPEP